MDIHNAFRLGRNVRVSPCRQLCEIANGVKWLVGTSVIRGGNEDRIHVPLLFSIYLSRAHYVYLRRLPKRPYTLYGNSVCQYKSLKTCFKNLKSFLFKGFTLLFNVVKMDGHKSVKSERLCVRLHYAVLIFRTPAH